MNIAAWKSLRALFYILAAATLVSCRGDRAEKESILLPLGEIHEGWYFGAGRRVVIEGTVNGDAYVAGGTVDINGTINGDLLVAGGLVTVTGTVANNIRGTGGTLRIDGKVGRDITVFGGSIAIGRGALVEGNMLAAGGDVTIAGIIGREGRFSASSATILGTVKGNVEYEGDKLILPAGASIGGNLRAKIMNLENLEVASGVVHGTIERELKSERGEAHILGLSRFRFWFQLLWIGSLLLTGLVLVFLFPGRIVDMAAAVRQRPGASAVSGIIGLVTIPFAVLILMFTLIAIPLALLVLLIYFWLLYVAQLALGVAVGDSIFRMEGRKKWRLFVPTAVGVVIVQLLTLVPFLRLFVILVELILGFGALLYLIWKEYKLRQPAGQATVA